MGENSFYIDRAACITSNTWLRGCLLEELKCENSTLPEGTIVKFHVKGMRLPPMFEMRVEEAEKPIRLKAYESGIEYEFCELICS